jgi:preprotein translocase SecY subunit
MQHALPRRRAFAGGGGGGGSPGAGTLVRPTPAAALLRFQRRGRAVVNAARKQTNGGSNKGDSSGAAATDVDAAPPRAPAAPPSSGLTPLQRARLAAQAAVDAADAEKAAGMAAADSSSSSSNGATEPSSSTAAQQQAAAAAALGMGGPSVSDKIRAAAAKATEQARPTSPLGMGGSSASTSTTTTTPQSSTSSLAALSTADEDGFSWSSFFAGPLPGKLAQLLALIALSRAGVYVRLPGVDVDAFSASMQANGLLGYVDALSGGSISRVGLFSLGIIPYINASIVLQLFSTAFPSLKKMQREDGPQGRARFQYYTKLAAFVFAIAQAVGQLTYIRPYVEDFSPAWLAGSTAALVAGAMALVYTADAISELRLGNGTSVLIFAGIASSLPTSLSALLTTAGGGVASAAGSAPSGTSGVAIYGLAFLLTTVGIIYVQEAERRIPVNYTSAERGGSIAGSGGTGGSSNNRGQRQQQPYLPFKVNATGVMPLIFASSLLGLPAAAARYFDTPALDNAAAAVAPGGPLYLPVNVLLIALFNYYYTFLQLEPKDLAEQLKRAGAAIPGVRPGKATAEFVAGTLSRMSLLGSAFLGALAAAPAAVEALTHLTALRGFAGTSVLIMVGVATDTARRIRAEQAMAKYEDTEKAYDRI